MFSVLAIALTERLQRAMESHLAALAPWLASLPVVAGLALAGARADVRADADGGRRGRASLLVLASRPWRARAAGRVRAAAWWRRRSR